MGIPNHPNHLIEKIKNRPLIERFPFPFKGDSYRYSNNSEALDPPFIIDMTPEYEQEIKLKRQILNKKKIHLELKKEKNKIQQCYKNFDQCCCDDF